MQLGDVQDIMTLLSEAVDDRSVNTLVGDQIHGGSGADGVNDLCPQHLGGVPESRQDVIT